MWDHWRMTSDETAASAAPTAKVSWHVGRLIIAWSVAAVFGALVTILAAPENRYHWLVLAIGVATLVTFALQLGTAQREGFISRLSFSIAGSVLVIAVIDGIGLVVDRL